MRKKQIPSPVHQIVVLVCSCFLWVLSPVAGIQAADIESPTGDVLLQIVGAVENSNSVITVDGQEQAVTALDMKMLESLPVETITTRTPWTKGDTEFTGVRMNVLMEYVGANDNDITLSALDEYSIDVTDPEYDAYPVILAYKVDGEYISVRELGPLWVMYPFDDYPDLDTSTNKARSVWQLTHIWVR